MTGADPCRRALTPVEDAALFVGDALRAAGRVMAGCQPSEAEAAYLAVYAHLAAVALGQDRRKSGAGPGGMRSESL